MTEINSEVAEAQTQYEENIDTETTIIQKNLFSSIITLMNKNPNYKMLGALGMMLVNFSVCITIAKWLKNSSLVS